MSACFVRRPGPAPTASTAFRFLPSFARLACAAVLAAGAVLPAAGAQALPVAPGYSVSVVAPAVTGDVAVGGGAVYVGVGSYGAGAASVVRIDGGGTTTLVTGLNAIAGMAYDASTDQLFFGDNGGELPGATSGDALYGLTGASTAAAPVDAASLLRTASGAVPGFADLVLDPGAAPGAGFFVSDASASFPPAGRLLAVDGAGAVTTLESGLAFASGLAVAGDVLYVGEVLLDWSGRVSSRGIGANPAPLTPLASLPGGLFDLERLADGGLLASSGGELVRIDPVTGATTTLASGFAFATGLWVDGDDIYAMEGGLATNPLYRLTPVPEPGSAALLLAGLCLLARRPRRARGV